MNIYIYIYTYIYIYIYNMNRLLTVNTVLFLCFSFLSTRLWKKTKNASECNFSMSSYANI